MNDEIINSIKAKVESLTGDLTTLLESVKKIGDERFYITEKSKELVEKEKALAKKEEEEMRTGYEAKLKDMEKEKEVDRQRKEILDARETTIAQKESKLKRILQSV